MWNTISTFNADFPRFWKRYVDDKYAVCNQRKVKIKMNFKFETIKFTVET